MNNMTHHYHPDDFKHLEQIELNDVHSKFEYATINQIATETGKSEDNPELIKLALAKVERWNSMRAKAGLKPLA